MIAACKKAAVTIKAKYGLNQFEDQNEYRKWLTIFLPLIQSKAGANQIGQMKYSLVIRQQVMKKEIKRR